MQGKTIKLGASIMLNDTANWQNWEKVRKTLVKNWLPIGSDNKPFKGTFDGGGNTIVGVYVNSKKDSQGLFGTVDSSGVIKKLVVSASYIEGERYVGGLVGNNWEGEISFSSFSGIVVGKESFVGGFAGHNGGKIIGSYFDGTVTAGDGDVVRSGTVGGFVGSNEDIGVISNCFSIGKVIGLGIVVGGFIGRNSGVIDYSYSTSDVTGEGMVGGFAGSNSNTIVNSYSTGNVMGKSFVGGLVGDNIEKGKVSSSYSIGMVTGKENGKVGGLVGVNEGKVDRSYYDMQTSKQSDSGKGDGKTTAQMKQKATFVGWDFKKVWDIKSTVNDGYPHLLNLL
jgi:hypothetical protein